MIKFAGETKMAKTGGARCTCNKCRAHDEHPELVGRPLSPQEWASLAVNTQAERTQYGPEIEQAWAEVEQARAAFKAADQTWEQAIREQSRQRIQAMQQRRPEEGPYTATVYLGNMPADPVRLAQDLRDEAADRVAAANDRHSTLIRAFENRQRAEEHAARVEAGERAAAVAKAEQLAAIERFTNEGR